MEILANDGLHRIGDGGVIDARLAEITLYPIQETTLVEDVGYRGAIDPILPWKVTSPAGKAPPPPMPPPIPPMAPGMAGGRGSLELIRLVALTNTSKSPWSPSARSAEEAPGGFSSAPRPVDQREQEDLLPPIEPDHGPLVRFEDDDLCLEWNAPAVGWCKLRDESQHHDHECEPVNCSSCNWEGERCEYRLASPYRKRQGQSNGDPGTPTCFGIILARSPKPCQLCSLGVLRQAELWRHYSVGISGN